MDNGYVSDIFSLPGVVEPNDLLGGNRVMKLEMCPIHFVEDLAVDEEFETRPDVPNLLGERWRDPTGKKSRQYDKFGVPAWPHSFLPTQ